MMSIFSGKPVSINMPIVWKANKIMLVLRSELGIFSFIGTFGIRLNCVFTIIYIISVITLVLNVHEGQYIVYSTQRFTSVGVLKA